MPDTTPRDTDARHPHSDLPPPGSGKESRDTAERFADALDALVLGARAPDVHDASDRSLGHLTTTAADIQRRHGTGVTANRAVSATPIGETRRRQIWEDLMARHARATSPVMTPTAQASTIGRLGALMQPWVAIDDERPARDRRASTGLLRFVPDPQPVTTLALVIAVLIAVGAGFSAIVAPGGPGVTPTASAEGLAGLNGQTGPATPGSPEAGPAAAPTAESSPVTKSCPVAPLTDAEIATIRDEGSRLPERAYVPVTTASPERVSSLNDAIRVSRACGEATSTNANIAYALITDRWLIENPLGPSDRQTVYRSRGLSDQYGEALVGAEPTQAQLDAMLDQYNAVDMGLTNDLGILGAIEGAPQVFRKLPDGRVISYPAELWLRRSGMLPPLETAPDRETFVATTWAFQRDRWLLDEQLVICLGDCDRFWTQADAELDRRSPATSGTPSALPAASPTASPVARGGTRRAT